MKYRLEPINDYCVIERLPPPEKPKQSGFVVPKEYEVARDDDDVYEVVKITKGDHFCTGIEPQLALVDGRMIEEKTHEGQTFLFVKKHFVVGWIETE